MFQEGSFIENYTERMIQSMKMINPDWTEKEIRDTVKEMIDEQGQNPNVIVDNNYIGETRDTTLLSISDYFLDSDDILAGNTTLYKNQYNAKNPNAVMLQSFLNKRKKIKKGMWQYIKTDPRKYADEDRKQGNVKKQANSYYGGSGTPLSAFYSKYSGPSTTCTAQGVISTAMNLFEGLVADNYLFFDLNELCEWLIYVEKDYEDKGIDDFIERIKKDELKLRLMDKIIYKKDNDDKIISKIVDNMDKDFATFVYYKNNIFDLISHTKKVQKIFYRIFEEIENMEYVDVDDIDWKSKKNISKICDENNINDPDAYNKFVNKTYFMDPNDPPKNIKDDLEELKDIVLKYVYTPYLGFDRIYRLKNFKRKCVTVIDTDSNILSLDPLVDFIDDTIIKGETFGRNEENNMFIMINTLTYILTAAITDHLLLYGKFANIPEEYRPLYNMKNEFYFSILVIGKAKKRYISKMRLREGNLLNPPKNDVKGFDFKKATCSEYAEKVYMNIVKKYVLGDEINVTGMMSALTSFRNEIIESIRSGDRRFLPNGSPKEIAAYADPSSEQSVRGVYTWNILYPDNMIELPSKVSLLKLNIFKEPKFLLKYQDID